MKNIVEYLNAEPEWTKTMGSIRFELDDESMQYLSESFRSKFENNTYVITEEMITEMSWGAERNNRKGMNPKAFKGNRTLWTKDGDELKMGDHGTQRLDRPVEKGGDGEHIDEREIIDIFKYTWKDLMDMYNEGYLEEYDYNGQWQRSFTTQCKCYLKEIGKDKFKADGARPEDKFLWTVWMPVDGDGYKVDIIIRTLFRGSFLKHGRNQERLLIANNGFIKQIKPRD